MVGETMKLSTQAMGSLMMALQKSLLEQSDITETLQKMEFIPAAGQEGDEAELYVKNPPIVKFKNEETTEEEL
tara:strand:- start:185 stop:403 length:219 start_codon:yes stop_codon:yes gene_type:complete